MHLLVTTYEDDIMVIFVDKGLDKLNETPLPRCVELFKTFDLHSQALLRELRPLLRRHDLDGDRCTGASPLADVHAARTSRANRLVDVVVRELLSQFVCTRRDRLSSISRNTLL